MSDDRGEYRAIRRVLLDGPDFQRLPSAARFVFVVLKINFGPAGIDVTYPAALVHQLAAQTGASPESIADSLTTLEEEGWIHREANVLWIVGQLTNDPHIKASDPKHRKGIVRHVAGLPRLAIVRAFVVAHPDFIPPKDEASKALTWAFQGPPKGLRSTDNKNKNKNKPEDKTEFPPTSGGSAGNAGNWVSRLSAIWCTDVGRIKEGQLGVALKPSVDIYGELRVERAMRAWIANQKANGKPCRFAWFEGEIAVWLDKTATPLAVIDGEMSDTLELLTRPAKASA